jgi:polyribonucleotide nucleotidyltransferase
VERINAIANPTMPKVGDKFLGTVVKTAAFGAFVSLLPGRDGLLHISKVGDGKRVEKVEDYLNVGDKVEVVIAEIDPRGKVYLDKVRPEGAPAPEASDGGSRDRGSDRGDRGGDRPAREPREGGDDEQRRRRHRSR